MAVSDITATVLRITGVTPTANSVEDAQRFVVSSVPKELLKWAMAYAPVSVDGSAIAIENDSIVEVTRTGYSCNEIPFSESIWANDSGSLKKATNTFPVYWIQDDGIKIAPATDSSNSGYVYYIGFAEIDDDCDLRNAVIYHTSAHEFSKLGSDELPTISINAVSPDVPTLTTITFSGPSSSLDATAPTFTYTALAAAGVYGTTSNFNDYFESGTLNPLDDGDPGSFTLNAVPPDTPIAPSLPGYDVITIPAAPVYNDTATAYTPTTWDWSTLKGDFQTEPGVFSINAVPPDVPTLGSASITITGSAPQYSKESQTFDIGQFETFLETEEDSELAQVQLGRLQHELGEYQSNIQNELNEFNKENVEYQAILQKNLKDADIDLQEDSRLLQKYSAEVQGYQTEVQTEVQEYTQNLQRYQNELGVLYQTWAAKETNSLQKLQAEMQIDVNEFNSANAKFQADIQKELQDAQLSSQEDSTELQLVLQQYQAETATYQAEVNSEIQEYTQKFSRYSTELGIVQQSWNQEQQSAIQESVAELQAENQKNISQGQADLQVAVSNKDRELQRNIQDAINDAKTIFDNNAQSIQKFQSEVGEYQAEVATETAEYQGKVQKQQAYSKESDKYYQWANAEVQMYIQNNSKMINRTMAAQASDQQQRAR